MSVLAFKDASMEQWLLARVKAYDNHTLVFSEAQYLFGPMPATLVAFSLYNNAHQEEPLSIVSVPCYFKVMNWLRRHPEVITAESCRLAVVEDKT